VPIDAPGLTIVARPAGRPGETLEHGDALFSRKYGQSTGVCLFERVFVPMDDVFYAGEWEHSGHLTYSYATHHRHTCIGARAGFGDLLIGAGALMCEANGFDPGKETHLREQMVELITITESFFACGVAASVYAKPDEHSHSFMPDPVFSNIGKLLLATKIYDMHRIAHYVSGGLIVTLPGPDEDHNPETAAKLSDVLRANPDVPYEQRIQTARFIEDLTAGYQGGWYSVISLHGGGSPAAMKQEIYRNYPIGSTRWNWWSACWSAASPPTARRPPPARPGACHHTQPPARQMLRHGLHRARRARHGGLAHSGANTSLAQRARFNPLIRGPHEPESRTACARWTSPARSICFRLIHSAVKSKRLDVFTVDPFN
jgi:hypothetical protein